MSGVGKDSAAIPPVGILHERQGVLAGFATTSAISSWRGRPEIIDRYRASWLPLCDRQEDCKKSREPSQTHDMVIMGVGQ